MKKFVLLFALSVLLINCSSSGSDDGPEPNPEPQDDGKPVAVNDNFNAVEDSSFIVEDLLLNDTVVDNARITAFENTGANGGSIIDNRNGTYTYTPPAGFVGTDTFSYTLCDDDATPNCSTATVSIAISDEGNPMAENDAVNSLEDATIILTELLENDTVIDDAVISAVDDSSTSGTLVLNTDGTITYTPQSGFLGQDSFSYTLCDDDSPENSCSTATVTLSIVEKISFNIPVELVDYYNTVTFSDISNLMFDQLESHAAIMHSTILSYGQRHQYLYNADEDENNTDNVILMYTTESRYWEEYTSGTNAYSPQTFNTEHVYPQSLLESEGAVTDLHHLRSCDAAINSLRSNYPFISGTGTYALNGLNWYPGDAWRGDVARMIMYLNIRYGETFDKVGNIELLLEWNAADPVSAFEKQRNNTIEGAQGNRNPFIDNPYLATLIWGGDPAENRWQ